MSSTWDQLRKKARNLETTIDNQLSLLAQISSSSGEHKVSLKSAECEQTINKVTMCLDQFSQTVEAMSNHVNSFPPSGTMLHMLQRHRDILFEYQKEFRRVQESLKRKREQEELLVQVKRDIYKRDDQELLLAERGHLDSSNRLADNVLE